MRAGRGYLRLDPGAQRRWIRPDQSTLTVSYGSEPEVTHVPR